MGNVLKLRCRTWLFPSKTQRVKKILIFFAPPPKKSALFVHVLQSGQCIPALATRTHSLVPAQASCHFCGCYQICSSGVVHFPLLQTDLNQMAIGWGVEVSRIELLSKLAHINSVSKSIKHFSKESGANSRVWCFVPFQVSNQSFGGSKPNRCSSIWCWNGECSGISGPGVWISVWCSHACSWFATVCCCAPSRQCNSMCGIHR